MNEEASVQPKATAVQEPSSEFAAASKLKAKGFVQPKTTEIQESSSVFAAES